MSLWLLLYEHIHSTLKYDDKKILKYDDKVYLHF